MRRLLTIALLLTACADVPAQTPAAAPAPPEGEGCVDCAPKVRAAQASDGVRFIDYPASRGLDRAGAAPVLADVLTHLPPGYGNTYYDDDPITHAHETTHGINSDIRNTHNDTGVRANGFYALDGRAVLVPEPPIRKSAVGPMVPAALRGSRYALYIAGSASWDDTPLYVADEWVAYTNGSAAGVDMIERGAWDRGWRDGVAGTLEFTIYGVALGMAAEQADAQWFASNTQFRTFIAWQAQRAMAIYRAGAAMEPFAWAEQDALYARLQGADGAPLRAWTDRTYGDAWTRAVFFGDAQPEPPADPGPGEPDPDPGVEPDPVDPIGIPGRPEADADTDGITDAADRCSATPAGAIVWTMGEWLGCAEGQYRDPPPVAGPDADTDHIADADDLCRQTAAGARVWRSGEWMGCAEGQFRDRDLER